MVLVPAPPRDPAHRVPGAFAPFAVATISFPCITHGTMRKLPLGALTPLGGQLSTRYVFPASATNPTVHHLPVAERSAMILRGYAPTRRPAGRPFFARPLSRSAGERAVAARASPRPSAGR
jgi:hypothetical protein